MAKGEGHVDRKMREISAVFGALIHERNNAWDRANNAEARVAELETQVKERFNAFKTEQARVTVLETDQARDDEIILKLRARVEVLDKRIAYALKTANGRWKEWGGRAESVCEILEGGDPFADQSGEGGTDG